MPRKIAIVLIALLIVAMGAYVVVTRTSYHRRPLDSR